MLLVETHFWSSSANYKSDRVCTWHVLDIKLRRSRETSNCFLLFFGQMFDLSWNNTTLPLFKFQAVISWNWILFVARMSFKPDWNWSMSEWRSEDCEDLCNPAALFSLPLSSRTARPFTIPSCKKGVPGYFSKRFAWYSMYWIWFNHWWCMVNKAIEPRIPDVSKLQTLSAVNDVFERLLIWTSRWSWRLLTINTIETNSLSIKQPRIKAGLVLLPVPSQLEQNKTI